jgi:hypothetical protein
VHAVTFEFHSGIMAHEHLYVATLTFDVQLGDIMIVQRKAEHHVQHYVGAAVGRIVRYSTHHEIERV